MRLNKSQKSQENGEKKSGRDGATTGILHAVREVAGGVWNALKRTSYDTQNDYRQFFLASDISQARIVVFFLALIVALYAISDYLYFGLSLAFYGLVALRVGLIGCCTFQFMHIRRVKNYRSYDTSTFTYFLVIVIGILLINATRPENFLPQIIVIDVAIFIFYLVIQTRFIYQAVPALVFTIGEIVLIMLTFESFMVPSLFKALFSLAFTKLIAALGSLQLHSYRWQIFQNFMDRKETERLVAIGQTAGMIGHDIRNPLQAIVSELYLAKDVIVNNPYLEEKAQMLESIDLIEEQTDYISKIVADLQDYARPLKPEYMEVDLGKLIISVFQAVNVPDRIVLKIDVKGFPSIRSDPTLIRRALTNLVNNAIQAMPDGGILHLTAVKTENRAVISVRDTGKGIPEEIKPKLFTPLMSTKAKGQGLGLAVVKRLVEALGGSVTFESELGKGTIFIISLPVEAS